MLQNYHYFLVLAEEQNISKAAKRLFISHQCLSKYLKDLEQHYHVALFNRKPSLSLTPAGKILQESLLQIQLIEKNIESQFFDYYKADTGLIHLGTTEGRYRILIPSLISSFRESYPDVQLLAESATAEELTEKILNNKLDMAISIGFTSQDHRLVSKLLVNENLYLVISETMLKRYFPERYPSCKTDFENGVNLREFTHVPFILNKKKRISRNMLDLYCLQNNITLNCCMELSQGDMHYLMTAQDYAASFCLSMYVSAIEAINQSGQGASPLHVFPINGMNLTSPTHLIYRKDKIFPEYGKHLIHLIEEHCRLYKTSYDFSEDAHLQTLSSPDLP